jgi:hypothetical protein
MCANNPSELRGPTASVAMATSRAITPGANGASTGTYRFQLHEVTVNPPIPIAFGDIVNGAIAVPGEIDTYTFDATAGQQAFFDSQIGTVSLTWRLTDPAANQLFNVSMADRGPVALPVNGLYTLTVDGTGDRIESHQFLSTFPKSLPVLLKNDVE